MTRLADSLPGDIHVFQLLPHFLGDPVGLGTVGFAHGIGRSEALAEGRGAGFREVDSLHDLRDGDNEIALGGEEFEEVFSLLASNEEDFPSKVVFKGTEESIQPLLVGERRWLARCLDQHFAPRAWETPPSGAWATAC